MENLERSSKPKPPEKKKTPYARFGDFLRKYRLPVLIVFGLALVVVFGVAAGTAITDASVKASTARLEKLDADYLLYTNEQDVAKKADTGKSLLASIDVIIKKGPRLFAAQKALVYRAKIEESNEDWSSAEKDWQTIVNIAPDSYLAPTALQGVAAAAEEQGASDRATTAYKQLIDKYPNKTAGIQHAYFALGRLAEQSNDFPAALVSYKKITSDWPDSDWTKLASDRIIFMKAHGQSK